MPVVFRESGLRYFFFSNEGIPREPPHVHIKGQGCDAKVWLEPELEICESYGFNSVEIGRILRVIAANRDEILRAWYDHFADSRPL